MGILSDMQVTIIAKCTWLCNNNSVYILTELTELPEYGMYSSGQDNS